MLAPPPPHHTKIPEELGSEAHSVSPWQNSPCFLFLSTANVAFPLLQWGALSSSASHLLPDGKWVIFIPSSSVAWHWGLFPAAACLDWDFLQDWSGIWLSPSEFPDWKGCTSTGGMRLSLSPHVSTETWSVSWSGKMRMFICSGRFICSVGSCRKLNQECCKWGTSLGLPQSSCRISECGHVSLWERHKWSEGFIR